MRGRLHHVRGSRSFVDVTAFVDEALAFTWHWHGGRAVHVVATAGQCAAFIEQFLFVCNA